MDKVKSFIRYFIIGVNYIVVNKLVVLFMFGIGIYFLNTTLCYKEELDKYKNDYMVDKSNSDIIYYYSKNFSDDSFKKIAASELVSCINQNVEYSELGSDITELVDEVNNLFNSSSNYFSFLYKDIYTGFTISYNENASIFTASTIKAPAMIYLYEMASIGEVDLDEELVYTSNFYSDGSGVLKDMEVGTKYRVDDLIRYSIFDSDNIAYKMLVNRYGRKNMYDFWSNKGTSNIFSYDTVWGITSASDAAIYMEELYNFYLENDEYGEKLMDYFKHASWKQITNVNSEYNTANKGGWSFETFHDVAIVFEKNPYILVILSETGESDFTYLFNTTSKLIGQIHSKYWEYKIDKCSNINQY